MGKCDHKIDWNTVQVFTESYEQARKMQEFPELEFVCDINKSTTSKPNEGAIEIAQENGALYFFKHQTVPSSESFYNHRTFGKLYVPTSIRNIILSTESITPALEGGIIGEDHEHLGVVSSYNGFWETGIRQLQIQVLALGGTHALNLTFSGNTNFVYGDAYRQIEKPQDLK